MAVMKKGVGLSLMCALSLYAAEAQLGTIDVEAKADTEVIKDVHGEDIKSADLAEALFKQSPSVSIVRRSGIANDIIVRGQKKDNISVTIDGAKVCGACPNRMDPPVSHVLTNNIDYIQINEGPYDVENFGVLSADVKIHTIKPSKELKGDINLGAGSFGYQKGAFSVSGGKESIRFLLTGSAEKSDQYKDGNGDDFVGQIARNIALGKAPAAAQYQPKYQNMDAYTKKTLMGKLFWDIAENHELRLSYTANRSDDVLYPSSKMDAIYDDSDIYNMKYIAKALGKYSKKLTLQTYYSTVEHPMSTKYRNMAKMKGFEVTHKLETEMRGAKLKNSFDLDNHEITAGLDYSLRNWDGGYYKNGKPFPEAKFHSIYDSDTENYAFFAKDKITLSNISVEVGLRYDDTSVTSKNRQQQDNDYSELNGYVLTTYHKENDRYYIGLGRSSRVPDAKELYWVGSMGNMIGTPNLDDTVNYELDLGMDKQFENTSLKAKLFYSKLDNFIAYNASRVNKMGMPLHAYENVDATIYGGELSGTWFATDTLYFDYGASYQRGEKDDPLTGQTGTDMPEIPPLKFNIAANYDYDDSLLMKAEIVGSDKWKDYDAENGEQPLSGYAVMNLKATKTFRKRFELTLGIDNLFNKTYAVSNTYKDLVLLTTGDNNVMLMNEPGRYYYANLRYKF